MQTNVDFDGEDAADGLAGCIGERKLWAEVISRTYYRATIGEQSAIHFFHSHMFQQLASMLDLPAQSIRERVRKATIKPQQKANKEN